MREVLFPREPSTFSAHGILQSDIVHDLARARIIALTVLNLPQITDVAMDLRHAGEALLAGDNLPPGQCSLRLAADLRYRGQAFELMVDVEDHDLTEAGLPDLLERFHQMHLQRFSFDDRRETVELVTLRLSAVGRIASAALQPSVRSATTGKATAQGSRNIYLRGAWREAAVFDQTALPAGADISGPAFIEQPYTTLIVPPGWRLTALPSGDLVACKEAL
jgi:N-methylhydantoinase A